MAVVANTVIWVVRLNDGVTLVTNLSVFYIAQNPVFHDRTKNIEIKSIGRPIAVILLNYQLNTTEKNITIQSV